jgi:parvulin-like peptidyl-prolyl isomerase
VDRSDKKSSRGTWWLAAGALSGAVLAATGILENIGTSLPTNTLAQVNSTTISKADYLGYLELLARDKRNPMRAEDRTHVLDRLIEEQLLIERGLEIGLATSDPSVRKAIVNAMIQSVISDSSTDEPTDQALTEIYKENSNYFAKPSRIQVRRLVFRGADAEGRANKARQKLNKEDFSNVGKELADRDILSLPNALLPVGKLRSYIGPSLTKLALSMKIGSFSAPFAEGHGYSILWLIDLQKAQIVPMVSIREQIIREYQRRQGDEALGKYLSQLRSQASVVIDEGFIETMNDTTQ